jgi:hypothetical protein
VDEPLYRISHWAPEKSGTALRTCALQRARPTTRAPERRSTKSGGLAQRWSRSMWPGKLRGGRARHRHRGCEWARRAVLRAHSTVEDGGAGEILRHGLEAKATEIRVLRKEGKEHQARSFKVRSGRMLLATWHRAGKEVSREISGQRKWWPQRDCRQGSVTRRRIPTSWSHCHSDPQHARRTWAAAVQGPPGRDEGRAARSGLFAHDAAEQRK